MAAVLIVAIQMRGTEPGIHYRGPVEESRDHTLENLLSFFLIDNNLHDDSILATPMHSRNVYDSIPRVK